MLSLVSSPGCIQKGQLLTLNITVFILDLLKINYRYTKSLTLKCVRNWFCMKSTGQLKSIFFQSL